VSSLHTSVMKSIFLMLENQGCLLRPYVLLQNFCVSLPIYYILDEVKAALWHLSVYKE
jgi:hypothetical protein